MNYTKEYEEIVQNLYNKNEILLTSTYVTNWPVPKQLVRSLLRGDLELAIGRSKSKNITNTRIQVLCITSECILR